MAQTDNYTYLESITTMLPELQAYYEAQFDMMASKGWVDMCEDIRGILVVLGDIATVTPDTLLNRQGRIIELSLILNRRETFTRAYEELTSNAT